MRARNITRLRIIALVTLVAPLVGIILSQDFTPERMAGNGVAGGLAGLVLTVFETVLQGPLRPIAERVRYALVFLVRIAVYVAVFRLTTPVAAAVGHVIAPASPAQAGLSLTDAFIISLMFNAVFSARTLMGQRTLIAFVTGRYHRPVQEERIVLFLDLRGSTGLAERLGDRQFHRFLNQVFNDLADPVAEAAGEIYRYVGDEVIITWIAAKGREGSAALACLFEIEAVLRLRRCDYVAEFGETPQLRGALHKGPVVIGEMGAFKREIVMLGDTMNTAARIVEACRSTGRDFIASAAALRAAEPAPPDLCAERLGALPLRGKETEVELYALSRAAADGPAEAYRSFNRRAV